MDEKVTVCRYSACTMREVVDLVEWARGYLESLDAPTRQHDDMLETARTLLWHAEYEE